MAEDQEEGTMPTYIVNKGLQTEKKIDADRYYTDEKWIHFQDANNKEIATLDAATVKSVELEGTSK